MSALMLAPKIRPIPLAGALLAIAFMAGCAQQRTEGYYNPPAESTVTDAQAQAQGAGYRTVLHAPSQLQIALKPNTSRTQNVQQLTGDNEQGVTAPDNNSGGNSGGVSLPAVAGSYAQELIPQAQTFQGTLPCLTAELQCEAQRVTLTLAPNGQWRARIAYLDNLPKTDGKPTFEQGCWDALQERPPRILLLDRQGNLRADFSMSANNTLRVRSVNGRTPNLNYTLTRQPDLDPVSELDNQPALRCGQ
ncbi:copper resistance protein NlpE N-terminal domain-containing protein [Bordetella avium]|uniref:copper resistance protein NlpE N-terminal domain-containing protein n=1 Tax=Bordetella avium TaxID=521 RepID=UPI0013E36E8E|nr:copper resistance protein NlpE N-terminal domain-containing protein [Bordetella avium]